MKIAKNIKSILGVLLITLWIFTAAVPIQAIVKNDEGQSSVTIDSEYAFIQFGDEPVAFYEGTISDSLKVEGGLTDLNNEVSPSVLAYPSSLSFGLVRPVGNQTYKMTVTLTNPTNEELAYTISNDENVKVTDMEVTIPAKNSMDITVEVVKRGTQTSGQEGTPTFISGYLNVSSSAGEIRIPYLYVIYNR